VCSVVSLAQIVSERPEETSGSLECCVFSFHTNLHNNSNATRAHIFNCNFRVCRFLKWSYGKFETRTNFKSSVFWDITPYSPLKVNRRFGGTYRLCLPPAFTLVSCSVYSSALKMEATCFSKISVDFQRTTRRYIPENSTLHSQRCENLKSYIEQIPCNAEVKNEWRNTSDPPYALIAWLLNKQRVKEPEFNRFLVGWMRFCKYWFLDEKRNHEV
jgi:hypothetical protein